MAKLLERLGFKVTVDLAERLTIKALDRHFSDDGLGSAWGKDAADAFRACFDGIKDMDVPGPDVSEV